MGFKRLRVPLRRQPVDLSAGVAQQAAGISTSLLGIFNGPKRLPGQDVNPSERSNSRKNG
jgi:hypothetical protein